MTNYSSEGVTGATVRKAHQKWNAYFVAINVRFGPFLQQIIERLYNCTATSIWMLGCCWFFVHANVSFFKSTLYESSIACISILYALSVGDKIFWSPATETSIKILSQCLSCKEQSICRTGFWKVCPQMLILRHKPACQTGDWLNLASFADLLDLNCYRWIQQVQIQRRLDSKAAITFACF